MPNKNDALPYEEWIKQQPDQAGMTSFGTEINYQNYRIAHEGFLARNNRGQSTREQFDEMSRKAVTASGTKDIAGTRALSDATIPAEQVGYTLPTRPDNLTNRSELQLLSDNSGLNDPNQTPAQKEVARLSRVNLLTLMGLMQSTRADVTTDKIHGAQFKREGTQRTAVDRLMSGILKGK